MSSPIIDNMVEKNAVPYIKADNYQSFINNNEFAVLFFAGDPKRYPETNDVAMVLPEIVKEFKSMACAIVDESFEQELQNQFDFTRWPALAFFTNGQYQGAITGIQNWEDYLQQIPKIIQPDSNNTIRAINL